MVLKRQESYREREMLEYKCDSLRNQTDTICGGNEVACTASKLRWKKRDDRSDSDVHFDRSFYALLFVNY